MQIAINEIHQNDAAWHRQVAAGRKSIETPGQILQVGSRVDLEAVTDSTLAALPAGLSAPILDARLLPSPEPAKSLQLTLDGPAARDAAFVRGNSVILLDPSTQIFHVNWREKRAQFAALPDLPLEIKDALADSTIVGPEHNRWWVRMTDATMTRAQLWTKRIQMAQRADIWFAMSPFIDGTSPAIPHVAVKANEIARNLASRNDTLDFGYYFNFHPRAFRKPAVTLPVLRLLEERIADGSNPRSVFFRIEEYPNVDPMLDFRARDFFQNLNALKEMAKLEGKPFIVILSMPHRGPSMVFGGVDLFIDHLKPDMPRGGLQGVHQPYGRYYHPGPMFKTPIGFDDVRELIATTGGRLPCACGACNYISKAGLPTDAAEWNRFRRVHFVNARANELGLFRREIDNGNTRDMLDWIGKSGHPEYANWLPSR